MKPRYVSALLVGVTLAVASTTVFAQNYSYPRSYGPMVADPLGRGAPPEPGTQRETGYGQGGTMGTHPTGANVGPARGEQIHAN
jgi:hypothetical protein